jgi:hypothetical protein
MKKKLAFTMNIGNNDYTVLLDHSYLFHLKFSFSLHVGCSSYTAPVAAAAPEADALAGPEQ